MRTALILIIASILGFAAPTVAKADTRGDHGSRISERQRDHDRPAWQQEMRHERSHRYDNHRYNNSWQRHEKRAYKRWAKQERRAYRDMRHRPNHHDRYRRPPVRVIYRDRLPYAPYFSIFLRFP